MLNYWTGYFLRCGLIAALCVVIAAAGADLTVSSLVPAETWLPAGVGLAVMIAWDVRLWPGIAAGSALALWLAGSPLEVIAGIAVVNTATSALGAQIFARGNWHKALERFTDVGGILLVASVESALAAILGAVFLSTAGQDFGSYALLVASLFAGRIYSHFTLLALLLGLAAWRKGTLRGIRWLEFASLIALKVTLETLTHAANVPNPVQLGLVASTFPLLVWAASRFNLLASGLVIALTLGMGMVGTAQGTGPIGNIDSVGQWMGLVVFGTFCAATGLMLNAAIETMRRLQSGLEAGERRLRDIADSASDFFWEIDAKDRLIFMSDSFAEFLGPTLLDGALAGLRESHASEPWRKEGDWQELWEHVDQRRQFRNLVITFATPSGERMVLQASGRPVFDKAGTYRGYRGACSDITRQLIESENLIQAQKMEALGQLTGGIAHDFNNLLAVVVGNVELARKSRSNTPNQHQFLDNAINAAERGAALVTRLLAFSRKQTVEAKIVNLRELIENFLSILDRSLGRNISVRKEISNLLGRVKVEPIQLETALLNLAVNARDAMGGTGEIVVRARNCTADEFSGPGSDLMAPGDYVAISVSDGGNGIPAQIADHIFEPFFTTKAAGQGTGLGLSMVYGFARQSGGTVTVSSVESVGTTMTIYLPRHDEDLPAETVPSSDIQKVASGSRVLVVDDNTSLSDLIKTWLEQLDYKVHVADDAKQALDLLRRTPDIDVLLTDLSLPGGLSGDQLALQAIDLVPNIRVLFMSGYAVMDTEMLERFGEEFPVMNKPFRQEQLALRLLRALNDGGSPRE